jgi:hypothetical protein
VGVTGQILQNLVGAAEGRLDFSFAGNNGKLLLIAWQGNPVDLDSTMQRVLVKEAERLSSTFFIIHNKMRNARTYGQFS